MFWTGTANCKDGSSVGRHKGSRTDQKASVKSPVYSQHLQTPEGRVVLDRAGGGVWIRKRLLPPAS